MRYFTELVWLPVLDNNKLWINLCYSSVSQSCPTVCDPKDCSTPGFSVLYCLLQFAQTHIHRVSDAFKPSHPLSTSSPPALNLSQHQGLFQWAGLSHQVDKVSELQASASASVLSVNIQSWFPLGLSGFISMLSKGFSRVFSSTTVWKHQFFSTQPFLWSNSHIRTSLLKKP